MTSDQWLICRDPGLMLEYLLRSPPSGPNAYRWSHFATTVGYDILREPYDSHWQDWAHAAVLLPSSHFSWADKADLLRCLFGPNPVLAKEQNWAFGVLQRKFVDWNDRTPLRIAALIYRDQSFHEMPILADALEEAGVMNKDILAHARLGPKHCRGCWVLETVLGGTSLGAILERAE